MGTTALLSLRGELPWWPVSIESARTPDDYPVLVGDLGRGSPLEAGDALVSAGGRSLRGRSGGAATLALLSAADAGRGVAVGYRPALAAGGDVRHARVELESWRVSWATLALSALWALAACAAFARSAGIPGGRLALGAAIALATSEAAFWGGSFGRTASAVGTIGLAHALWGPLALLALARIGRPRATPLPLGWRLGVWVFALRGPAATSAGFDWPVGAALGQALSGWLDPALVLALGAGAVGALRRADRPDDRRSARWAVFALAVAAAPALVTGWLRLWVSLLVWDPLAPEFWWLAWLEGVGAVLGLALPAAGLVAAFRARAADVDRWASATLSYSLLGAALLVGLIAVVPGAARAAASALEVDPRSTELLLAVALALGLVPLDQRLRTRFDGWLFPERRALRRGLERWLRELDVAPDVESLFARAGAGLDALLRPEAVRVEGRLEPGSELAPVFLAGDERALTGDEARRGHRVAVRAGDTRVGSLVLGPKQSGDDYSPTDRALLAAFAERLAARWQGFRDRREIEQGRARAERSRAEAALAQRENLAKSRFLAAASHDLRQPLHALGLFVETLDARAADTDLAPLVGRVRESTRSLEEMLNALLDLSKLDAGGVEPELSAVALGPLFERVCGDLEPLARARGLRLRARDTGLWVRSDPILLARILQNLVTNAIRYTDRGGVLVAARRRGDRVAIEVRDSGRGIPPEKLEAIFGEFRQLEREVAEGGPGLGLGLSIVERLCRLLDHPIDVRSTPDRGSLFRVRAPRAEPAARAAHRGSGPGPADPALAGRRIWVVDDDASIRDALRELLTQWGIEVRDFASLGAARSALRDGAPPPELMLTDDQLERETGLEVVEWIRAEVDPALPTLVVTGEATPERLRTLRDAGHPVLRKPVAAARLRAALAGLLGGVRGA